MSNRVLTEDEEFQIYMDTEISGARLAAVNRILARYGFEPLPECCVGDVLGRITPMEMGRYLDFCTELAFVLGRNG